MSKPDTAALATLATQGWERSGDSIGKMFRFETFRAAMAFVTQVATLAEQRNHHPMIRIDYNKVRLELTTHDAGGLSEKDTDLAQAIEGL